MKTDNKIFLINGGETQRLHNFSKKTNYLFNPHNFSQLIHIGDIDSGIDYPKDLYDTFSQNIHHDDEVIYIILNMHGLKFGNEVYKLQFCSSIIGDTRKDDGVVCAEEFFYSLSKATQSKRLYIFALSCHGAYLHDFFKILERGSILITLSNHDNITNANDFYHSRMQEVIDLKSETDNIFKYLLFFSVFFQRFSNNVADMSWYTNDQVLHWNLEEYATKFYQRPNPNYPSIVESLLSAGLIDKQFLSKLSTQIFNNDKKISDFRIPSIKCILDAVTNEEVIKTFEGVFYPENSLSELKINFESLKKIKEEYQRLKATDNSETSIIKHLNDNRLQEFSNLTFINLHSSNSTSPNAGEYDDENPINLAIPSYSLLLGVAAADFCIHQDF